MQGCKKDNTPNPYQEVNDWILDNMKLVYLWNTHIPSKTNKTQKPDVYFESLKYKDDRYSFIHDNFMELIGSLTGINIEAGYEFDLASIKNSSDIFGYITYIKPGTPAESAGLKRGDFFLEINNTQMTVSNYRTLLQEMSKPHTLRLAKIEENKIYPTNNVSIPAVIPYKENPILLDTIYNIKDKKIGYFVYNFFARDSEDLGIAYEKELNNLFGNFISKGIDELIVDLRYNMGGTVISALALASMISNRSSTDIFGYEEYNSILNLYFASMYGADHNIMYFLDHIERINKNDIIVEQVPINKLSELNRVYIIVSGQSASASELLINGLRPYMGNDNVVLIGETTVGKNVGSTIIYEDDPVKQKKNTWGMLPIIVKLSNSQHFSDYANGFKPNVEIHEFELEMKPLGDTDELLLSTTLDIIFGTYTPQSKNVRTRVEIINSSRDRIPARQNMYIDLFHKRIPNHY